MTAQVGRNGNRQDRNGLGPKDEHAVAATSGDAPNLGSPQDAVERVEQEPVSLLEQGQNCATCIYSHHWSQPMKRRVVVRPWSMFRSEKVRYETYDASGIQCVRYPKPMNTEADHGCGEYREFKAIDLYDGES